MTVFCAWSDNGYGADVIGYYYSADDASLMVEAAIASGATESYVESVEFAPSELFMVK
jgi:hypothetical protein